MLRVGTEIQRALPDAIGALDIEEIAGDAIERMLPRPRRVGHAQDRAAPLRPGAHDVGDDAILGIVAPANDVAAARDDQPNAARGEIGRSESARDHFRGRLGSGIGIPAAERIVLFEGHIEFVVVVDLVGGDDEHALQGRPAAQRREQVGEAEDVDGDGLHRIGDGAAHQRLGGVMQYDFGIGGGHRRGDRLRRAQIADARVEIGADAGEFEQRRVRLGRQGEAGCPRAEPPQPQRGPGALEAGVAGQQHAAAAPEIGRGERRAHAHVFHGARPDAQCASSRFLSRKVSIGCQKPEWR